MAYRSGTYLAFHANGQKQPAESDRRYYELLKAWRAKDEFVFTNSHEKTGAVRDSSKKETLRQALRQRLRNSKNMVLIVGETTAEDTDWVPEEIRYAVDECGIPIIAAYPGFDCVMQAGQFSEPCSSLEALWPTALATRINSGAARVLHVPFKQLPLADAVPRFTYDHLPNSSRDYYSRATCEGWGLIARPIQPIVAGISSEISGTPWRLMSLPEPPFLSALASALMEKMAPPPPPSFKSGLEEALRAIREKYRQEYDALYGPPNSISEILARESYIDLRMGMKR